MSLMGRALGLVFALAGCPAAAPENPSTDGGHVDGSQSDGGPVDASDVDASACVEVSQPCTTATECCSGNCGPNDTCWPATCMPTSAPCTLDIECCTAVCGPNSLCD